MPDPTGTDDPQDGRPTTTRTTTAQASSSRRSSSAPSSHPPSRHKRRKMDPTTSSSSGSDSSSGDDDDLSDHRPTPTNPRASSHTAAAPVDTTTSTTSTRSTSSNDGDGAMPHQSQSQPPQQSQQQPPHPAAAPEGWRVKLYRLNQDGSWDDCGTGRILCLYHATTKPHSLQAQQQPHTNPDEDTGDHTNNSHEDAGTTGVHDDDDTRHTPWAPQEATLCVNAETAKDAPPRVLLRTRILLTDAYQRQGDNIITWCEPCYYSNHPSRSNTTNNNNNNTTASSQPHNSNSNSNNRDEENPSNDGNTAERTNELNNNNNNNAGTGEGVDLALSFQDNAGCLDIWRQIAQVQSAALTAEDLAAAAAAQHCDISNRLQSWDLQLEANANNNNSSSSNSNSSNSFHPQQQQQQHHHHHHHHHHVMNNGNNGDVLPGNVMLLAQQLPSPPTLQNLEDIADTIAALQHVQQRESLAAWIAATESLYLKELLALFPAAEARGDYGKLATLAACVKTILLLNDPSILELLVSTASLFEDVCSVLEYDPDLREKANHRWFLRERAKFRTVVPMENAELVASIHRSFRVNYLRDTLLRPTMDESSLSTLSSLQTFTHSDVIKGVTMTGGQASDSSGGALKDSYLVQVIRLLGVELHALIQLEWEVLEKQVLSATATAPVTALAVAQHESETQMETLPPAVALKQERGMGSRQAVVAAAAGGDGGGSSSAPDTTSTATWRQHVAPQDFSVTARKARRRGSLSFLRELFTMVRISLQQCDKEDFFSVICTLEVDLHSNNDSGLEISDNVSQTSQQVEVGSVASTVRSERLDERSDEKPMAVSASAQSDSTPSSANLLSLLGCILSDPNADTTEKGSVLEILAGVAMHDPSLIRRHCLDCNRAWKRDRQSIARNDIASGRPEPNEKKQVIFLGPANDLLSSLLFLLDVETDAGILLQVSEIMRIILDTDIMGDHGPMSPGFADEAEGIPPGSGQNPPHDQHTQPSGIGTQSTDQKRFLSIFYEHYVEWLVAPFQFTIMHPARRVPDGVLRNLSESVMVQRFLSSFEKGISNDDGVLCTIAPCAIRTSFAVELLSFCVRAHLYRMKSFILKSRVLGNVLKLLRPYPNSVGISGDRCLKLAALRFLRAVLSVNDEFYHRHIIQHNLFAPVFEAFRANPVGDNLVSSAIVEMCDYIHSENIKSLLEHIVKKHLTPSEHEQLSGPSLEDVSSPYVTTLTTLRKAFEANSLQIQGQPAQASEGRSSPGGSRYFSGGPSHDPLRRLSGKALEDQRKFRESDQEESYFDDDDDDEVVGPMPPQQMGDEDDKGEGEMHRTPRMFSLAQVPLLSDIGEEKDRPPTSREPSPLSSEDGDHPASKESNAVSGMDQI